MKRTILALLIILFYTGPSTAQIGQFAVVRPNGTTYICPTWDSAYNKAVDGDYVYLPGITIAGNITINKKLFLYGAGHHPDSSAVTGKTSFENNVFIQSDASGGSIEGVNVIGAGFGFVYTGKKINGYTIKRCRIPYIYLHLAGAPPEDSLPTNIFVTECALDGIASAGITGITNVFTKNVIMGVINSPNYCLLKNNIFIASGNSIIGTFSNSIFENNVFLQSTPVTSGSNCNNSFYNNLKLSGPAFLAGCASNTGIEIGTITVPAISDVFLAFDPTYANFPYLDNYHLKPTCPGVNAGTDGTDVGIYGTTSPAPAGWVPSNPHIYFKQVAPETNSSGQLNIQFKVRTSN